MSNKNQQIELLSPAGSFESMIAAIKGGCNAVYFGVEQLNMRARSVNNFTLSDLNKIAEIGSTHNIKTYLTLNTVLYDYDLRLMKNIIQKAKESGINAIIASDISAINFAFKIGMPVHISTQSNITNIEAVEFYSTYSDTMVLARELSLSQVAAISNAIKRRNITGPSGNLVKLEIFAHGALCMAVSGKCYLSLHSHNASANRGACIQNCRHTYIVTDKEDGTELEIDNEYIMSAKDLCTIDILDKIFDAGVSILKIEGRGRAADYVYTTTKCYKEAIEAYNNGLYNINKVENWKEYMAKVYNRGFWNGYYLGTNTAEWSDTYGSKATQKKILLGYATNYYPKANAADFLIESHQLKVGDKIMITGPSTGYLENTIEEMRINNIPVAEAIKGDVFSIKLTEKIRKADKIYKIVNA